MEAEAETGAVGATVAAGGLGAGYGDVLGLLLLLRLLAWFRVLVAPVDPAEAAVDDRTDDGDETWALSSDTQLLAPPPPP